MSATQYGILVVEDDFRIADIHRAFIEQSDDATFAAQIADRFSVDNFLRSLAVDCANGHWDNMWYGANNYFLYANPDTGRFEYIPYDLDNTGGIVRDCRMGSSGTSTDLPPASIRAGGRADWMSGA